VVSTTPRPFYSRERPGTNCTGGWVCPRSGLDVCENSRPHRDLFYITFIHHSSKSTYIVTSQNSGSRHKGNLAVCTYPRDVEPSQQSTSVYNSVSQTVVRGPQVVLGFCPCGPLRLNISPKKTEKIKLT
jgi:hypothetical protein